MCGICGFVGSEDLALTKSMTQVLWHRGPDDQGYYCDGLINLGFRRLSIIDIEKGHQPMTNSAKDVVVMLNGEIYNYKELRKELIDAGTKFQTNSDTEVLLHLYEREGITFLSRLVGMYAIVIYDRKDRKVYLIADRFLKKPLYYWTGESSTQLVFGSEIKALLKHPVVSKSINYQALHHYLSFKHIPKPLTIYQGVSSLEPAEIVTFDLDSKKINKQKYWETRFDDELKDITEDEAVTKFLELLDEAIRIRLVADVDLGVYLSGGLDSGAILSLMSRYYDRPIATFSMVYRQDELADSSLFRKNTERHRARFMAERFNTEHYEVEASLETLPDDLNEIIRCVDEPFAGAFTYFYLSRFSKNYVKSILSGDGGDEHFGSYRSHLMAYPIHHYNQTRALHGSVRDKDAEWLNGFDLNYVAQIAESKEWDWRIKLNVWNEDEKSFIYSDDTASKVETTSTVDWYRSEFKKCEAKTPLNRMLEMERRTKFSSEMMVYVDRFNMANSVECRCPMVDHRLVDFTSKLPDKLKLKNGNPRYIYKKAMRRLLPDCMIDQKKEGLIMPVYDEILGKKYGWARKVLSEKNIKKYNVFDASKINSFLDVGMRGDNPYQHAQKVWNLVVLQTWLDDSFG